jgi:type II secretory pathway pseudopilin PulG
MTLRNSKITSSASVRRGITLLEVIVGAAMLVAVLAVSAQAIVQVSRHQKRTDQRLAAMDALENALEELSSKPWEQINDAAVSSLAIPAEIEQRWPGMKIEGSVSVVSEPVEAKRITLSIHSGPSTAGRGESLTTWVYRKPGS